MWQKPLLLLSLFILFKTSNQQQSVDELISQVFGNSNDQLSTNPPPSNIDLTPSKIPNKGGTSENGDCSCVSYYLCKNNTIITDGVGLIDIRMKESQCENYFEICCGESDKITEPIKPPAPITEHPPGCGWRNPEGVGFRIKGNVDSEAAFAEFPWMVAILKEEPVEGSTSKLNVYQCGGSLIHPKAVLTAAHCVTGKNLGKKFKIRAGEWDTQTKNEIFAHQDREVESIVTHDHYKSGTLYNDIAILFLKDPVEITDNVDIVCLPPSKAVIDAKECFASGWGKDTFGKEGKYQVILKKVELPMVPHAKCQEQLRKTRLGRFFELHSSFVCAGGIPGKDTCKGDGGSPLVCPIPGQKGRYHQAGIVAWGIGCGEDNTPGVYVNIAHLRNWVDEQMQYQRLEMSSYTPA